MIQSEAHHIINRDKLNYLLLRRELGFTLIQADGWLHDFATFMEQQQATAITLELAWQWAVQPRTRNRSSGWPGV
jgi:hypothetical protein